MNKSEVIDALATSLNITKSQSSDFVNAIFDGETGLIATTLKAGDDVSFQGFGTFKVKDRKARTATNPKTGEKVEVAAKKAPKFTPGKGLKALIA